MTRRTSVKSNIKYISNLPSSPSGSKSLKVSWELGPSYFKDVQVLQVYLYNRGTSFGICKSVPQGKKYVQVPVRGVADPKFALKVNTAVNTFSRFFLPAVRHPVRFHNFLANAHHLLLIFIFKTTIDILENLDNLRI